MVYTLDKLNFIIGPTETNDDVAIQKVIEHLEWEEGRKATPDEIATITTDVRRMMAAHTAHSGEVERSYRFKLNTDFSNA